MKDFPVDSRAGTDCRIERGVDSEASSDAVHESEEDLPTNGQKDEE